jgi:hypothetical protein
VSDQDGRRSLEAAWDDYMRSLPPLFHLSTSQPQHLKLAFASGWIAGAERAGADADAALDEGLGAVRAFIAAAREGDA